MRASLLSLALTVLSLAAPEAAAQVPVPACDNFVGREVFAELYGATTGGFKVYRATDGGVVGGGGIRSRPGCDFIWELRGNIDPGSPADIVCEIGQPPCNDARNLYLLFVSGDVYLYSPLGGPGSFYSPVIGGTNSPDIGFGIFGGSGVTQVKAAYGQPTASATSPMYYENVLPNGYVMPYDSQTAGAQGGYGGTPGFFLTKIATNCPAPPDDPRLSAGTCGVDPMSYRFAPQGDARLPPEGGSYVWDLTGITLSFGPASRLVLDKPITITAGTLTATDPANGWAGVRVAGGTATLTGNATVERVGQAPASLLPPPAASVIVSGGGEVVLDGARLRDSGAGGLLVSGKGSSGRVLGGTLITDNAGGPGVLATSRGSVTVESDAVVITGNAGGVAATGTGSRVLVTAAQILSNDGPGVRAAGGGRVDVLRYTGNTPPATPTTPTVIDNNVGGLYAMAAGGTGGGLISSGVLSDVCCDVPSLGNHNFRLNNIGPAFDIRSLGGSAVEATRNYWGTTSASAVEREKDASSYLEYQPVRTTAATAGVARGVAGTPGRASLGAEPFEAAARVRDDVLSLVRQAEGRVRAGDGDAAAGLLISAWMLAETDDDRLAVSESAGRTLAAIEPASLVAWSTGAGAWGMRARAAGLVGHDRAAEAAVLAATLAATAGTDAAGHRVRGLSLLVEAAVAAGDAPAAVSALSALADADPEGAADLAVSVALAFPEAVVSLKRGVAGAPAVAATAEASPGKVALSGLSLSVGPNPSSGVVRVALTGAASSEAEIAVYDVLGRQVAVLHRGVAGADAAVVFDGSALPVGLYVVRAVVRGAAGTSVLTRAVTVAR